MGWGYFITLFVGMMFGAWFTMMTLNRYYRSEIWTARKRVMLARLLAQERKAAAEADGYDLKTTRTLDERMGRK